MSSVLKVDNIEKYYGSKANLTKAIDRISFEVEEGEYIGIMGASGSGKTTLLNCISTIDQVTAGNIMINGMDITKLKGKHLSRFRREELGFIFQDFNLLDTLTAFENIALALTIMKIPAREIEDRVRSIAEKLMITEVLNKYSYQMSGGQKQRVASARAMITNPSLILADEPTGALDSKAARMLLDSMETMNVELNATILMVTHDYSKIALSNVKKSIRDYTIYFLTLTFGICLFYMFNSVQAQQAVLKLNASQKSMMHLMSVIINGISVFVAIILGFLIVYANQFLMKRRHKEMGIYLLLGMEKRQVSKILLIETLLIGVLALIAGLVSGVFLSQGLAMLTAKMFAVQMKEFKFVFSQTAFIQTILYFAIIFIIVMIFNGITISKYKLINLLNSAKKNQKTRLKNPILSVILFLISIGILGIAYHLIQKNQMLAVDNDFKISVLLGVVGTFLFFFSLSGFLLELAKRSKKFYYNGLNMFVLRQINSKITTTFVSMSMLCLMLFLAISAFATGSGLASSVKTDLEDMTKFDCTFYGLSEKGYQEEQQQKFIKKLDDLGLTIKKDAKEILPITIYQNGTFRKCRYKMEPLLKGREKYSDYTKDYVKKLYETPLTFAKLSEYNKIRKAIGEKELTLKSDEYILNCDYGNLIPIMEKAANDKQKLTLDGKTYKMKYGLQKDTYMVAAAKTDMGTVILNDEIIQSLKMDYSTLYLNLNWKGNAQKVSRKYTEYLKQMIINSKMPNSLYSATISKEEVYEQSTGLSTIMTYIAIYIGLVFLITCAAVLALQQLSENADNIEKYKLLSKIGTSQKMINRAIKAQIILYFCLPLSLALIHSYVGIKTAKILISTLGQINITKAAAQSLIIVIVIYIGYMIATYLGSKSMLKEK